MTEEQKWRLLAGFRQRAQIAEENYLPATAKSWRDLHDNILGINAANIIFVDRKADEQDYIA